MNYSGFFIQYLWYKCWKAITVLLFYCIETLPRNATDDLISLCYMIFKIYMQSVAVIFPTKYRFTLMMGKCLEQKISFVRFPLGTFRPLNKYVICTYMLRKILLKCCSKSWKLFVFTFLFFLYKDTTQWERKSFLSGSIKRYYRFSS